jgi:hypothetical protein
MEGDAKKSLPSTAEAETLGLLFATGSDAIYVRLYATVACVA